MKINICQTDTKMESKRKRRSRMPRVPLWPMDSSRNNPRQQAHRHQKRTRKRQTIAALAAQRLASNYAVLQPFFVLFSSFSLQFWIYFDKQIINWYSSIRCLGELNLPGAFWVIECSIRRARGTCHTSPIVQSIIDCPFVNYKADNLCVHL